MSIPPLLRVDDQSPIPIRRQLTEQLKHLIEGGGVAPDQPLPSIRELAGALGINPNTVARVIEDLKRGGYVEARRGSGVFVAATLPARPSPHLRASFLKDVVIRAAALGMSADDLAVGVSSLVRVRPAAVQGAVEILLVECSPPELDFFARELEAQLPARVDKVRLEDLAATVRRAPPPHRWAAAVTSFSHFPDVARLLSRRVPVIPLLTGVHLETLRRLAQLSPGTRVGVASATPEAAHTLEHSIAAAGLPNIVVAGSGPAAGAALGRLVRRVDVIVCATEAAERVRRLAGSAAEVIVDDRELDPRAIEMLAAILVRHDGAGGPASALPPGGARRARVPRRSPPPRTATRENGDGDREAARVGAGEGSRAGRMPSTR